MVDLQDSCGFEQMYEAYFRRIYNYVFCRLLHKEQTEDVVSRIFMKVLEKRQSYDERKASFNTWIFTIARNTLNDFYRLRKAEVSIDDDRFAEPAINFEEQSRLIADEELRELYMALTDLDEKTRMVITLKYFGEFTNREISVQTGINESTVSTLCGRGIAKLQKTMESMQKTGRGCGSQT
ncbi:MAG TPA: sigma-70 family RNA polymerase sigma factor [Clostridia bacterium]|nr:sigma-70 family RNA polymerase sigma factor [Clostridia bacterium]